VRATCVPKPANGSIVFVNAVQDRYDLKTTTKSASVGLSMLGSVSVPIGSSGANLVRVASNTVQNVGFYSRFFDRVAYYMPGAEDVLTPPPPEPETPPDPVPVLLMPDVVPPATATLVRHALGCNRGIGVDVAAVCSERGRAHVCTPVR